MLLQVLQWPDWHGTAHELGDLSFSRGTGEKPGAVLVTHRLGWEVRLLIGAQLEVVQTQVCRTQEEVFSTGEHWKAAMLEKGWQ